MKPPFDVHKVNDKHSANVKNGRSYSSLLLLSALAPSIFLFFYQQQQTSNIPTPKNEMSACKLHYSHFHIYFTLPPLIIFYFLAKPFLTQLDYSKLILLPIIAFVWTTPWDNELVRQNAWWYPRSCVLARIGYVPVEEYAFFIVQSLITALLTILITRWSTPRSFSKPIGSIISLILPLIPLTTFAAGILGLRGKEGNGHHFYISMIAWWSSVPLILLWYGTRRSWLGIVYSNQSKSHILSLIIPTIYLCYADVFALRRGTWHITEAKSLEKVIVPDLPIEEATFFFVTNLILVSACFAFDRVVWQCRSNQISKSIKVFNPISPTYFRLSWSIVPTIWSTFLHLDEPLNSVDYRNGEEQHQTQISLDRSLAILETASKSFHTASTLLPWDLRMDLGCLYAFARAMDDFIDTPISSKEDQLKARMQSEKIEILRMIAHSVFDSEEDATEKEIAKNIKLILNKASRSLFDTMDQQAQKQKSDLQTSAEAVGSLRFIVPLHLWLELIRGYAMDVSILGPQFKTQKEQLLYAQNVAGSIGDMCVRVVLARSGVLVDKSYRTPVDVKEEDLFEKNNSKASLPKITFAKDVTSKVKLITEETVATILRDARRMGVSLQLINIARDVIQDAKELKRCYLVLNGMDRKENFPLRLDFEDTEFMQRIFDEKMKLVSLARSIYHSSLPTISLLPYNPAKTGLRVACAVYTSIGDAIEADGVAKCHKRSRTSTIKKLLVVLKAMYF